jgi:phosphoribosyl-AMP cyclohydrolase
MENLNWLDKIRWTEDGLVPVIAQDIDSGKVVMFAWMNRKSLALSNESGYAVYWSRSRQRLWRKGEESGNRQKIITISVDCDADVLLLAIQQQGGIACHTGRESCFYRTLENHEWVKNSVVLKDPTEIYTNKLLG